MDRHTDNTQTERHVTTRPREIDNNNFSYRIHNHIGRRADRTNKRIDRHGQRNREKNTEREREKQRMREREREGER